MENIDLEFKIILNLIKSNSNEGLINGNKEYENIEKCAKLKLAYYKEKCFDKRLMEEISEKEMEELVYAIINFDKGIEQLEEESNETIYAMNELGERYCYANMDKEALKLFEEASNKGCIKAKYNKISLIGKMHYYGKGINKDYTKAFGLFSQVQETNAQAKFYLSKMYLFGYGVEEDEKMGENLIDEAVRMRSKEAIEFLFFYNANMVKLIQELNLEKNCAKKIMKFIDSLNVEKIKNITQKEKGVIDIEFEENKHYQVKLSCDGKLKSKGTFLF